jgi:hypothetical protein
MDLGLDMGKLLPHVESIQNVGSITYGPVWVCLVKLTVNELGLQFTSYAKTLLYENMIC